MSKTFNKALKGWQLCHDFVLFFDDFPAWLENHPDPQNLLPPKDELLWEYDDLFKGTNAHVYIPLWASACMGKADIILDETTLEVIFAYHEKGYKPIDMDGNPPDFIGQQFRFLAYLHAAALRAVESGGDWDETRQPIAVFTDRFLKKTVKAVAAGMTQYGSPLFREIARNLEASVENPDEAIAPAILPENLVCSEAYHNGLNPPD